MIAVEECVREDTKEEEVKPKIKYSEKKEVVEGGDHETTRKSHIFASGAILEGLKDMLGSVGVPERR